MVPTIFAFSNRKWDHSRRRNRRIPSKRWIVSIIKLNWGWELKALSTRVWGVLKLVSHNIIENYYRRKHNHPKRIADANILRVFYVCQYHSWDLTISILLQSLYSGIVKWELISRNWIAIKRSKSKSFRGSGISAPLGNIKRIILLLRWWGSTWSSFFARTLTQNLFWRLIRLRRASYWISWVHHSSSRISALYL